MNGYDPLLLAGVALAAFAYSSVGHGGASAYLALGALAAVPQANLAFTALVLNVLVSGLALWRFRRAGHFLPRLYLPLVLASAPASFVGARVELSATTFELLLGVALGFGALRLVASRSARDGGHDASARHSQRTQIALLCLVGLALGVVSGMLGIGGGIFLSPILLFAGWASVKQTAAVSAAFIVTNSLIGLGSRMMAGARLSWDALPWVLCAFAGGLVGARLGAESFDARWLRVMLAGVLIVAAAKLVSRGFASG